MAAKAEGAFRSTARPDRPQVNADGRQDGDMENRQDALRELFGLFKLQGNAPKSKIEDASATAALVADDCVGVGSDHGDTFRFALNCEGRLRDRRGKLLSQSPSRG